MTNNLHESKSGLRLQNKLLKMGDITASQKVLPAVQSRGVKKQKADLIHVYIFIASLCRL